MPCTVKKTFEAARDTGNVLIAQVKTNQPILHQTLDAICTAEPPIDSAEIRRLAKEFAKEEAEHVEILEQWIARERWS